MHGIKELKTHSTKILYALGFFAVSNYLFLFLTKISIGSVKELFQYLFLYFIFTAPVFVLLLKDKTAETKNSVGEGFYLGGGYSFVLVVLMVMVYQPKDWVLFGYMFLGGVGILYALIGLVIDKLKLK